MFDSISTLADLFTRPDFQVGVLAGAVGLGVLYAASREDSNTQWWGVVFALAALLVINTVVERRLGVSSGLFALGAGGWLLRPGEDRPTGALGWALVVAGAVLVGWRGGLSDINWLPLLTPVAIVIAGIALSTWSTRLPHNLLGPMMAITAFGIWVTVPETEHARVLLGVSLPLAAATVRPIHARLSTAGAFALAGMVVWVVAIGGDARPGSIIGGWASLGLMVILPFVRPSATMLIERRPFLVVGLHALFVLVAARVIGLWESAVVASIAVLFIAVLAFVVVGSFTKRSPVGDQIRSSGS
jgi:hypothetical protein